MDVNERLENAIKAVLRKVIDICQVLHHSQKLVKELLRKQDPEMTCYIKHDSLFIDVL